MKKRLFEGKDVKDIFALALGGLKHGAKNSLPLSAIQGFAFTVDFPVSHEAA